MRIGRIGAVLEVRRPPDQWRKKVTNEAAEIGSKILLDSDFRQCRCGGTNPILGWDLICSLTLSGMAETICPHAPGIPVARVRSVGPRLWSDGRRLDQRTDPGGL